MNLGLGFLYVILLLSSFLAVFWLLNFVESTRREQRRRLIEGYIEGKIASQEVQFDQVTSLTQKIMALTPKSIVEDLRAELESAGIRSANGLTNAILAKWAIPFAFMILGFAVGVSDLKSGFFLAVIGGGIGFLLPNYVIKSRATSRNQKILASLPKAIDLLSLCVKAGMSIEASLRRICETNSGPLEEELGRTLKLLEIGQTKAEAFTDLGSGKIKSELTSFANTFVRSDRLGIPLSGILEQQAIEIRSKTREAAKTQANKLPVKILFPLMLFFLPAVILIVLGPAIFGLVQGFGAL
jgi:tight adherence protein C